MKERVFHKIQKGGAVMSENMVDYSFRPVTYFQASETGDDILSKVKGAVRRQAIKGLMAENRLDEMPEELLKEDLDEETRQALGRIHPSFMGGEYLPSLDNEEVMIAIVTINSTLSDTVAVLARSGEDCICYRVVDEYNGGTLGEKTAMTSRRPLTLRELLDFFLGAWDFLEIVAGNCSYSVPDMLEWFSGDSSFYPSFHEALAQEIIEMYGEEDDDDEGDIAQTTASIGIKPQRFYKESGIKGYLSEDDLNILFGRKAAPDRNETLPDLDGRKWSDMVREVEKLRDSNHMDEAMELASIAYRAGEYARDPHEASELEQAAIEHRAQGRLSEAEEIFWKVLEIREKAFGREHPNHISAMWEILEIYRQSGRQVPEDLEDRYHTIRNMCFELSDLLMFKPLS
ncbi:MAG TPA: hypothetical protein DCE03_01200 [Synergistaceae bacterium]|nr:hypothetical protein [Synergistaceae bacterium]HAG22751.1 hypothetical protein [Synergistaceae bacterium]